MPEHMHLVATIEAPLERGLVRLHTHTDVLPVPDGIIDRLEAFKAIWDAQETRVGREGLLIFWALEDAIVRPGRYCWTITLRSFYETRGVGTSTTRVRSGVVVIDAPGGTRAAIFQDVYNDNADGMPGPRPGVLAWTLAPAEIAR